VHLLDGLQDRQAEVYAPQGLHGIIHMFFHQQAFFGRQGPGLGQQLVRQTDHAHLGQTGRRAQRGLQRRIVLAQPGRQMIGKLAGEPGLALQIRVHRFHRMRESLDGLAQHGGKALFRLHMGRDVPIDHHDGPRCAVFRGKGQALHIEVHQLAFDQHVFLVGKLRPGPPDEFHMAFQAPGQIVRQMPHLHEVEHVRANSVLA